MFDLRALKKLEIIKKNYTNLIEKKLKNKVDVFLLLRRLCNKENNTELLGDVEFLFSYPARYFTRSLRSLVRYRVEHTIPREIPYLRAPYIIVNVLRLLWLRILHLPPVSIDF